MNQRTHSPTACLTALCILLSLSASPARSQEGKPAVERTARCADYEENRRPLFGQLHLHTQYSVDAATIGTRLTPRDAYAFARGAEVGLAPFFDTRRIRTDDSEPPTGGVSAHPYCMPGEEGCQYTAMRTLKLPAGRELDFVAVTDHSEWLGETNICFFEGMPCGEDGSCEPGLVCQQGACVPEGYGSASCRLARGEVSKLVPGIGTLQFGVSSSLERPQRLPFCAETSPNSGDCAGSARNVWQQTTQAAKEAYDACRFTSFVGYEYTAMPLTMNRCAQSLEPCFAQADCKGGPRDRCAAPGQCADPPGEQCFVDAQGNDLRGDCGGEGTCVANGGAYNLHRNIIFRNANVPEAPVSYVDATTGCGAGANCNAYQGGAFSTGSGIALGSPTVMLERLEELCNPDQDEPCEFLSIPHNSNLSGGAMFMLPESPRDAEVRAEHERLVEIFQIKGGSECRSSRRHPGAWQGGAAAPDEFCDFENMSMATLGGAYLIDPDADSIPASSYVRNALKAGLAYRQQRVGENAVNPFKLGFVGSLDNHNGTATATEVDYAKTGAHGGNSFAADGQMMNETFFLGLETNGGGIAVVWAEENTRDSIFDAMQRRETYATSGTRPVVRFFGSFGLDEDLCRSKDFAADGYAQGVPMGGTLSAARSKPRFAVYAAMDTGWDGHPGTTLQRAQIVKGWVDAEGEVHEQVYDVTSGPTVAVDPRTCEASDPLKRGLGELCTVWEDESFDPGQHAFYYARILENPSCRWNQYYCLDRGVDCSRPPETGADVVGYNAYEYRQCCGDEVPKTVQQRAWTSPIWYEP